ncbi:hypothetical protein ACJX0J_015502, partial [Zea mays]
QQHYQEQDKTYIKVQVTYANGQVNMFLVVSHNKFVIFHIAPYVIMFYHLDMTHEQIILPQMVLHLAIAYLAANPPTEGKRQSQKTRKRRLHRLLSLGHHIQTEKYVPYACLMPLRHLLLADQHASLFTSHNELVLILGILLEFASTRNVLC